VDVFAPADDLVSAWINDDNDLEMKDGTSGAAPIVAGIVARFLEENPTATPEQVRDAIVENAALSVENEGEGSPRLFVMDGFIDGEDPPPTPPWIHPICINDPEVCLFSDQWLDTDEFIESESGQYRLILQGDQNLVLYDTWDSWTPVFHSDTVSSGAIKAYMQDDGNFTLLTSMSISVWSTDTNGNAGAYMVVQNDGNVIIQSALLKSLWMTGVPPPPSARALTAAAGSALRRLRASWPFARPTAMLAKVAVRRPLTRAYPPSSGDLVRTATRTGVTVTR
jgi:hypothetical protein